jgi:hypothetical protein
MSHHFKAKGGTVFNFNSDLSGPVEIGLENAPLGRLDDTPLCWSQAPCADLFEFVDHYRREYRDVEDDEQLTDEERVQLLVASAPVGVAPIEIAIQRAVAKLLRIHDRYKARVEELERPPLGSHAADLQALRATQARVEELEQQYARFAADAYDQEGCGPAIADDKVRLMAWVMGGGDPDDPSRPGPPVWQIPTPALNSRAAPRPGHPC